MKKLILVVLMVLLSNAAMAKFYEGANRSCYLDGYGWNEAWFCGKGSDKCAGKKATGGRREAHYLQHGDSFYHDGKTYWCCNGTEDTVGRFYEKSKFYTTETKTVQLDTGTCSYTVKKDICGNVVEDVPCTEATNCAKGIIKRNGECVEACEDGFAFESEISNKCVGCPESAIQGISGTGYEKQCIKCASGEMFDRETGACTKKAEMIPISKEILGKCYRCPNTTMYKQCVLMLGAPEKLPSDVNKSAVRKNCYLEDDK